MADCYSYNCDDALGSHTINDCNSSTKGGYPNILLVACGTTLTDPSDEVEVQAAIDAGTAFPIKNVKAALPAPTATTVDSMIANEPPVVASYEFAGTLMDQNVNSPNLTFYNNMYDGRTFGAIYLHNKNEGIMYGWTEVITFQGGMVLPDSKSELERFESTFNFSALPGENAPTRYTEPAGIFD